MTDSGNRPATTGRSGAPGPAPQDAAGRAVRYLAARSPGPAVGRGASLTLNFHPDRETDGVPILAALARDGVYRSQFATGTSNGGLTAYPGGDRWRWESRLFGGAYDDAPADERPVYGALNFRRLTVGAAPRFGSAHLRLRPAALARATFCYPDSFFDSAAAGVDAARLIALAEADDADPLDDYLEAQVHGRVLLARDVAALVLDPCYRGTAVERDAARLPFPVEWHGGFRLTVGVLRRRPDFRGPETVALGERVARDGRLDPALIGAARRAGRHDEQALKRLWHCLARFGAPARPSPGTSGPA